MGTLLVLTIYIIIITYIIYNQASSLKGYPTPTKTLKTLIRKFSFTLTALLILTQILPAQDEQFTMRVLNPGYQLNSAWEITYGPDDSLWITENFDYKVSRISAADGGKTELINLSSKKDFTNPPKWPQGGLMGLVLHPSMYSEWPTPSKPYVYLAYVYHFAGCESTGNGPCRFKTRIVRYKYNRSTRSLSNEQVIIESLNGSNDHNAGRLAIGKIDGTNYLFYTIGDLGAGQFNNGSRTENAQVRDTLEGKVLRFNLEKDGDADQWAKWIPNDNPFTDNDGHKTAVWSMGHRNQQGIISSQDGILYSSEHQDKSDDEVNIIEKGGNYGWPKVSGYCDGNYNGLILAGQQVGNEQANCANLNAKDPIYTFYTESDPASLSNDYLSWPTIAPSSIDIYEQNVIPDWNRSLLITSLKGGVIYRLKLNAAGTAVTDSFTIPAMRFQGRYRDLCISPDGLRIYVACDKSGAARNASGGFNTGGTPPPHAGRILEFTYTGHVMAIDNTEAGYERSVEIEIYPNPASKILQVRSIKNISNPLRYSIHSASGKLVLQGKSNTDYFQVNTATLSAGVYIFKLYNVYNIQVATKKVIIQ